MFSEKVAVIYWGFMEAEFIVNILENHIIINYKIYSPIANFCVTGYLYIVHNITLTFGPMH